MDDNLFSNENNMLLSGSSKELHKKAIIIKKNKFISYSMIDKDP